jgi:hypothetical protein
MPDPVHHAPRGASQPAIPPRPTVLRIGTDRRDRCFSARHGTNINPGISAGTHSNSCLSASMQNESIPVVLFEGICAVRAMLGVDWTDMGQRVAINNVTLHGVTQVPMIVVVVSDLMWNAVGGNGCDHVGLCDNKQSQHLRFHGTKDIGGLLASGGLQKHKRRRRPLSGKPGWNHYPADLWRESVQYAIPQHLGNALFRCVCEYDIRCWNSCGGGRTWHYTKDVCKRYNLVSIWLFPACLCSEVPINSAVDIGIELHFHSLSTPRSGADQPAASSHGQAHMCNAGRQQMTTAISVQRVLLFRLDIFSVLADHLLVESLTAIRCSTTSGKTMVGKMERWRKCRLRAWLTRLDDGIGWLRDKYFARLLQTFGADVEHIVKHMRRPVVSDSNVPSMRQHIAANEDFWNAVGVQHTCDKVLFLRAYRCWPRWHVPYDHTASLLVHH